MKLDLQSPAEGFDRPSAGRGRVREEGDGRLSGKDKQLTESIAPLGRWYHLGGDGTSDMLQYISPCFLGACKRHI